MPGFVAQGYGGMPNRANVDVGREYYYSYTWEIMQLFESRFKDGSPLLSLLSASLPTFTVNKESYQSSSLEYKFAKGVAWNDIKVEWYDTTGLLDEMKRWRQSVWTPSAGLKLANDYKKLSVLTTYLPTGQSNVNWSLINSWPSEIRYGDVTYGQSEVKMVQVSVTYDWAEENSPTS